MMWIYGLNLTHMLIPLVQGLIVIVLETTQQVVDVTPYNKNKYEPETNIPIVKAATAYTTSTGTTYILVLNQALYLPELDHS